MGRSFSLTAFFAVSVFIIHSTSYAQGLQADLEAKKVLSARQGQSVSVLALGNFDAEEYAKVVSKDFSALAQLLPNVASLRIVKSADGKNLLMVKVRGLSLSSGLVFEVKEIKLAPSGYLSAHTPSTKEIPLKVKALNKSGMQSVNPILASVFAGELSEQESENKAKMKEMARIELVGPLNELRVYPGLQMSARLSFYEYTSASASETGAMSLDLGFYQGRRTENIGDIRGFGVAGMRLAEKFTENYMSSLQASMQKFDPTAVVSKESEGEE